jgi:UDP-N-acetylglucosamine 2-epimerase
MKIAAAMVGNSSSGIIEAASFHLPVVNVGNRQAGRIRGRNVIDTDYTQVGIEQGLGTALSADFRASLDDLENPYGDGHAAETIVRRLKEEALSDRLLIKRFYDQEHG